jgi:hypothetical protein
MTPGRTIQVSSRSRYASTATFTVVDRGTVYTLFRPRAIPPTPTATSRRTTAADRPDLVAYQYYHEPERWWRIADANRVADPYDTYRTPGSVVRIPVND